MKKLLTLFLVLWCSTAWAVEPINLARSNPYVLGAGAAAASCQGANPSDCKYRETFEGSSECIVGGSTHAYCDNVEKMTSAATNWSNLHNGTSPLQGSYSATNSGNFNVIEVLFDASGVNTAYASFIYTWDVPHGSNSFYLSATSGGNPRAGINLNDGSNHICVTTETGTTSTCGDVLSGATKYMVLLKGTVDTGNQTIRAEAWYSASPYTSWTGHLDSGAQACGIYCYNFKYLIINSTYGDVLRVDDIRVHETEIKYW